MKAKIISLVAFVLSFVLTFLLIKGCLMLTEESEVEKDSQQQTGQNQRIEIDGKRRKQFDETLFNLRTELLREQEVAAEESSKEIGEICEQLKSRIPDLSREAAAPMQGFANSLMLVRLGAEDSIRKTSKRDNYIVAAHANLIEEVSRTLNQVLYVVEVFETSTKSRINQYQSITLELAKSFDLPSSELNSLDLIEIEKDNAEICRKLGDIAIGVTVEAALVRSSVKTVTGVLKHVSARLVSTVSAGGAAAMADGPFPFGDTIGAVMMLGGGVWIVCDVQSAAKEMDALPRKIEHNLNIQINELRSKSMGKIEEINKSIAELF